MSPCRNHNFFVKRGFYEKVNDCSAHYYIAGKGKVRERTKTLERKQRNREIAFSTKVVDNPTLILTNAGKWDFCNHKKKR